MIKELTLLELSTQLDDWCDGYDSLDYDTLEFLEHLLQENFIDTYFVARSAEFETWTEVSINCEVRNGNQWVKWVTVTYEHEVYLETDTIEELLELINSYEVKSGEIKYLIEYNNKNK